jgi:hypothetical protein
VAETFKAEAQRDRANLQIKTTTFPKQSTTKKATEGEELKKLDEASYEDDLSDEENEDDEYDDDDEDMENDELDEDEEVMTQCPDYCKCAGQYAAAMTATYVSVFLIGSLCNRKIFHSATVDKGAADRLLPAASAILYTTYFFTSAKSLSRGKLAAP